MQVDIITGLWPDTREYTMWKYSHTVRIGALCKLPLLAVPQLWLSNLTSQRQLLFLMSLEIPGDTDIESDFPKHV